MLAVILVSLLALVSAARPFDAILGGDPKTWSPTIEHNETEMPDKCTACKTIVSFIENQQKICTVVPKNMEAICNDLVKEYTPDVICGKLCAKKWTYTINL